MTRYTADALFDLLPAFYRQSDEADGGALRGLLTVIARELEVTEFGVEQLYDNQFVETAADWIVPYLGAVVGYSPLPVATASVSPRADLANTVAYRRRKGTPLLLERLARDVTGWPARVEESFSIVAWTQHPRHVRRAKSAGLTVLAGDGALIAPGGTASLRDESVLKETRHAFNLLARHPDARRVVTPANSVAGDRPVGGPGAPRPSIANLSLSIFVDNAVRSEWTDLQPVPGSATQFRFDLLGRDRPLFQRRRETAASEATPNWSVPRALSRLALARHSGRFYSADGSIQLGTRVGEEVTAIHPSFIRSADLSDVGGEWGVQSDPDLVLIDPQLGRVRFGTAPSAGTDLVATTYEGRPDGYGAGTGRATVDVAATALISRGDNLAVAIAAARMTAASAGSDTATLVVRHEAVFATPTEIGADPDRRLELTAASDTRPVLVATEPVAVVPEPGSELVLTGLLITGAPLVINEAADLEARTLRLRDCTLVPGLDFDSNGALIHPGFASLLILHPFARVVIERCILGPIVAVEGATVDIRDSIIDSAADSNVAYVGRRPQPGALLTATAVTDAEISDQSAPGAALCLERSTIRGRVQARSLTASDSIVVAELTGDPGDWPAALWVRRRQEGCVRFCFLPAGSRVPQRFHCVEAGGTMRPTFSSLTFGHSRFGQLHPTTPPPIRRGASDAGEMGATNSLKWTAREDNLTARLAEYLRFGMELGFSRA